MMSRAERVHNIVMMYDIGGKGWKVASCHARHICSKVWPGSCGWYH